MRVFGAPSSMRLRKCRVRPELPTIPFATIDLSSDNPIAEILNAPKFSETGQAIYKTEASQRALISAASSALIYTLVRNAKPRHVVEIGTYDGGTSEVICQALYENGSGTLHTVGPFDAERVVPIFNSWPQELRRHLEFYPMTSMDFYYRLYCARHKAGDRLHRWRPFLSSGAFRYSVVGANRWRAAASCWSTMYRNRDPITRQWISCDAIRIGRNARPATRTWADPNKAFDRERSSVPETDFEILRAPRGYSIGSRPVTFGEMPSGTQITGLRIHAESAGGTLHVQCALRGFAQPSPKNRHGGIEIATSGKVDLMFPQPIVRSKDHFNVARPSWAWFGAAKHPSSLPKFQRSFLTARAGQTDPQPSQGRRRGRDTTPIEVIHIGRTERECAAPKTPKPARLAITLDNQSSKWRGCYS